MPGRLLCSPSCGARNCLRLGAAHNFDRCAVFASLFRPPDALRRKRPKQARYQLRYTPTYILLFVCRAACFARPLAVPEIVCALVRRTIPTAAPFSPRCFVHRTRFGENAQSKHAGAALHPDIYSVVCIPGRLLCSPSCGARNCSTQQLTANVVYRKKRGLSRKNAQSLSSRHSYSVSASFGKPFSSKFSLSAFSTGTNEAINGMV